MIRARLCRFCGQPLSALESLRGDHCGRLDCHRAAVDAAGAAERAADLARRRRAALRAGAPPAAARAAVIWLQPHETRMAALPAAVRAAHLRHLQALVQSPPADDDDLPAADPAPDMPVTARVCGFCAGRCCQLGGHRHAFLRRQQLLRWVAARPGTTLAEAAADYAQRLPRRHVAGSCVYHGPQGCVLPREMRADICNTYLCEPLKAAQQRAREAPADGSVLAMACAAGVLRAAWVDDHGAWRLPRRPRRTGAE